MTEETRMDPALSPEEVEWVRRAVEVTRRRFVDGDFAPDPENRDKLIGGLQGVRTVRPAPAPSPPPTRSESDGSA